MASAGFGAGLRVLDWRGGRRALVAPIPSANSIHHRHFGDFNAGSQYQRNKNNFSLSVQNNYFDLDNERFRHAFGGSAQWLYNFDAFNQAGLYGQFSRLKYNDSPIRNADRSIVGVNAGHAFQDDFKTVIFASIYGIF